MWQSRFARARGSANWPIQAEAAEMLNASERSVRRAAAVLSQGAAEVIEAKQKLLP